MRRMGWEMETFALSQWVPRFRPHTIRTRFVTVPKTFLRYLLEDGIVGEISERFPELASAVEDAMKELGGPVMPKFSTRSPLDAVWMMPKKNAECSNSEEVFLMLKSSDRVVELVEKLLGQVGEEEDGVEEIPDLLALRKWSFLNPSMEFRCFANRERLYAVSQRHVEMSFPHLHETRSRVLQELRMFFDHVVLADADSWLHDADHFVVDVYIDREWEVWLVDFAPFGDPTDPLLFDWDELLSLSSSILEFRSTDETSSIRPSRIAYDGLPYELQGQPNLQSNTSVAETAQQQIQMEPGNQEWKE